MKRLKILNVDNHNYVLEDKDKNKYKLYLEFYDINTFPKENDYLYINELLLNEKGLLSFGSLTGIYGRDIIDEQDKDIIVLIINNEKICLKRYYG